MQKSESIAALAAALSKAQADMHGAHKDKSNAYFKSRYADLMAVWDACRKPLSDNGLCVIQTTLHTDGELVSVETTLAHSSGEWITGVLSMKPAKADPQGIGSCLTYARRYALSSIVGIAPEDDDGNAATHGKQAPATKSPPRPEPKNTEKLAPIAPRHGPDATESDPFKGNDKHADGDPTAQPDMANSEGVKSWREVVVHVKKAKTFGKKLGDLDKEMLLAMYNGFKPSTPPLIEDAILKKALVDWFKEAAKAESDAA